MRNAFADEAQTLAVLQDHLQKSGQGRQRGRGVGDHSVSGPFLSAARPRTPRTTGEQIPRIFPVSTGDVSEVFRLEASRTVLTADAKPL
jgi:hypothetical protein